MSLAQIRDGTSNTILLVEATGTGTHWAEPVDLDASELSGPFSAGGRGKAGSHHPGGMNAAFCDGSVRFLSDAVAGETLHGLITRAGKERIESY